jgi:hypothetical protein
MNAHARKQRRRALCLAIFIFVLTAGVQFTHTCFSDEPVIFPYGMNLSFANESYLSLTDFKPCIACLIIQTFNAAKIALIILLLFVANQFRFRPLILGDLHHLTFASVWFSRAPPSYPVFL